MTRTALRTLIAAAALVAGLLVGPSALAGQDHVDVPEVDVSEAERYWACVALDHVEVGACVGNPYPDLRQHPTVPELVEDVTGVRAPTVPRP